MSVPSTSRCDPSPTSPPGHGRPDHMARQSSSSSTLNRRFFSSSNPAEDALWVREGSPAPSSSDMTRGARSGSSSGADRARSTSQQQSGILQRPPMPPSSGSSTSRYGAYHANISTSEIDFSDVAAMGSGRGASGSSASPRDPRTTPYLGTAFPDPGIDLSWDGTVTPTEARDVAGSLGGLSGTLAEATPGSGRNQEEISPWLFQGADSPGLGSATPSSSRESRGGLSARSLSGSQSTFSLRPTTPPSGGYGGNGSSSNLSMTGSTPGGTTKRSRNPLKFLKKKSSQAMGRDPDATPSPPHHRWGSNEMPPAVPPLPSRVGTLPGTAAVLAARGRSNSYVQSVQGIEDELMQSERTSAMATASPREGSIRETKRRVLRRPRTRDKEREKSRGEEEWAGILEGRPLPGSGAGGTGAGAGLAGDARDVEISLDTNFDHIDDIIDVTKRKTSGPIGPMNEELSPREELISQDTQLLVGLHRDSQDGHEDVPGRPRSTSATMQRPQPRSSDSSVVTSSSERDKDRYPTISGGRAPTLRRFGSGPTPTSQAAAGASSPAKRGAPQVNVNRPGLRRITLAEAQQHLASRSAKSSSSAEAMPSSSASPASPWQPPAHRLPTDVPTGSETDPVARDARKDSAISNNSQRSGVSPKSSSANLAAGYRLGRGLDASDASVAGNWSRGGGVADPLYRFPPPQDATMGDIGGVRRSSASSASKAAASTWMAPDSWAVQPDRMRDYLRDEEESDADDDADAQSTTTTGIAVSTERERDSSSAAGSAGPLTGSITSILRSGSRDGSGSNSHHLSSIFGSRRGTQDSNASGISSGSYPDTSPQHLRHTPMDGGDFEVLRAAEGLDSHRSLPGTPMMSPPHTSSGVMRPSSRGGAALAAAGGAAAAAAGKLGLRSKHRGGSRPNTAGSMGGGGAGRVGIHASHQASASTHVNNGVLNGTADDDTGRSIRGSAGVLKRPSTISTFASGRPYTMRIYKSDGSLLTVAVPLYATTAELRSALARKGTLAWSGAFRLFVRDKGAERPLGEAEKPAMLQRRRMEQAGYTEDDGLEELGGEDLSYLLKFVYRTDSVTEFDSEAFGNTEDRLRLLDLQNQNLEMVPIFLYRHANWIVSLDLSGNPMSDLPSDFIQSATSLRTLRLSRLALKRVPQSVRLSESLTHLELSDNRIPELSHIALDEMPQLTSIKVQNNRLSDLPSYFARMSALKYLNLSNNRFEVFPAVLCELRGLVEIDLSFNALTKLPDPQLGQLEKLERLVLVGNSIDVLPPVVSKLVSLQAIDLRRNLLQDVSMLFSLPRLQDLHCEHNAIKAINASFGPRLRSLDAGHNPLSRVSFGAAAESSLTSLNLTSANLAKLDDGVFSAFKSLSTLVLDRNHFVVLPDSLAELTHLQFLSCNNNRLATLPEGMGRLSSLRRLHVHNNNLKTLPSSIWHCGALMSINVSSNLLESFPSPSLAGAEDAGRLSGSAAAASILMAGGEQGRKGSAASLGPPPLTPTGTRMALPLATSLKKLRLGDNRLTDDVFTVLGLLSELEILNLSFNEIYEIPNFGLTKFPRLVELYLSGNNLSSIPADDIPHLSQLRILHLNANKLQTLPAEIKELKKLHNLDVGNNTLKYNISNQQYDWNWNSSPALRYLNLSGNKRFEIKSSATGGGQMGARRPDIASDFQRLQNLRVLGLMDVTMTLRTLPDPHEDRRVRTSLSHINSMAYGISDALGKLDHLSIVDVVMPEFRKDPNQCLFGLFEGRDHGRNVGSRIASHLAEWVKFRVEWEMQRLQKMGQYNPAEPGCIPKVMRRAFLRMEKEYADMLMAEGSRKISNARLAAQKDGRADAPAIAEATNFSQWRSGASAVIAYINDKTLYIANAGDALAVLSRNGGTAYLVSTKHEPFDRDETLRIRSAEGWVSLRGYVNDRLDLSRSFGYYHLSPIVNAAPAVATVQLTDSDEFVILANRVLWNYMSYQTAVDIARQERDDLMVAAQKLRDFAISYGAEDSIMVMIVAVGDLFNAGRQQRDGYFDPAVEAVRQRANRGRAREDLPGDRTLARLEREVAPPIGQVALVFTDIKNSTSLWETNGGMQSAMRLHNYLLRRQLRTIGGYEVKTEGDAFMCSFPSVTSALLWCFSVQLQLLREDWPQELLDCEDGKEVRDASGETIYRGLSVRMGIHWGYPVCEADPITRRMDYFGPMVNRASRISGAADGGQILVSRDVISELTALLGTFGERDEETDGEGNATGRRRGDQNDEEQEDEDTFRLLNPNVSRDIVLLRRMGFGISEMGERKLKGLETPEFLNLVYPKQLAGRLEVKADAPAPQVFEPTVQLLDIDQIKHLGVLCLRLEALSDGAPLLAIQEHASQALQAGTAGSSAGTPGLDGDTLEREKRDSRAAQQHTSLQVMPARRKQVEKFLTDHPELLIYSIRDDATDEELVGILGQLVSRISNALSTLQLRQLITKASPGAGGSSLGQIDIAALQSLLAEIRPPAA